MLGAIAYGSELAASLPLGLASDLLPGRLLMPLGALASGLGTGMLPFAAGTPGLIASRVLHGLGVAGVTPPLLGMLAQLTARDPARRARVMSFFELSLLSGLGLGGVVASQSWARFGTPAFGLVALLDAVCAILLFIASRRVPARRTAAALAGLREVLRHPSVRRIAPSWLCVNAVIGLWLGPTLTFLLLEPPRSGQYLDGLYAHAPQRIGWLLLGYTVVFGVGVSLWSIILPKLRPRLALASSLVAMLGATLALYAINHSGHSGGDTRAALLGVTAVLVVIESGFTPAALSLLAGSLEVVSAKGAAMGIYSVLLGLGAVIGSLLAGVLGALWQIDGLLLGTLLMALAALFTVRLVSPRSLVRG